MSYLTAKRCFEENVEMIGEPMSDPQTFNLNQGLHAIASQLNQDMHALKRDMTAISAKLQHIETLLRRR